MSEGVDEPVPTTLCKRMNRVEVLQRPWQLASYENGGHDEVDGLRHLFGARARPSQLGLEVPLPIHV